MYFGRFRYASFSFHCWGCHSPCTKGMYTLALKVNKENLALVEKSEKAKKIVEEVKTFVVEKVWGSDGFCLMRTAGEAPNKQVPRHGIVGDSFDSLEFINTTIVHSLTQTH
ncbi:unnamed protein product [Sphenostylis stenocarpa]|uniref:Uncharacterized protein n=1 Tax=Sphenostylis stenocarpa TaxID=92480 RepID=A0AA86TAW3_9FABA|nr:unnamed protein product [Sphenostylis stenocarpa]